MVFWYSLLALLLATAAVLVGLAWRQRLSILAIVPMALVHTVGLVLVLAGVVVWLVDPLAAVGEYGDDDGGDPALAVPLLLVGAVLLLGAWFLALRRRTRR
jgi:hypothetical protein